MPEENIFASSAGEFRKPRVLTFCGLMCAAAVVLNFAATIEIGQYIRIGFSGIPNEMTACFFGPVVGAVFSGVLDVVKFLVRPTGVFFPGFTLSAALGGLIYGIFLYKKPICFWRVLAAQAVVKAFVNVGLNTLWLKILFDRAVLAILPARAAVNAVMLPIDTAILYAVLRLSAKPARMAFGYGVLTFPSGKKARRNKKENPA